MAVVRAGGLDHAGVARQRLVDGLKRVCVVRVGAGRFGERRGGGLDAVGVAGSYVGGLEAADEEGVRRVRVGLHQAGADRLDADQLRGMRSARSECTVEIGTEQERDATEGDARGDGQGSQ